MKQLMGKESNWQALPTTCNNSNIKSHSLVLQKLLLVTGLECGGRHRVRMHFLHCFLRPHRNIAILHSVLKLV